eukprot:1158612-Pelagomonas_calceolata.AAC.2
MPESHACHACALYEFSLALLELHAASQLESRTVVVGGRELSFETGEVARLADGSCVLRQGGTTGAYVAGQGGTAGLCIHAASSDSVYEEGAVVFILCAEAGRHTWCAHPSVQDAVHVARTHCKHSLQALLAHVKRPRAHVSPPEVRKGKERDAVNRYRNCSRHAVSSALGKERKRQKRGTESLILCCHQPEVRKGRKEKVSIPSCTRECCGFTLSSRGGASVKKASSDLPNSLGHEI